MNSLPAWTLEPAAFDDLERITDLKDQVMRADLERLGRWDPDRSRRRVADSFSTRWTSVLLVEGAFAGSVTVRPDEQGGRHLELFYLAPHLQGRGLGTAVLRRLLAEADAAGEPVRLVVLRGSAAQRLYERHGFTVVHEDPIDVHMHRPAPEPTPATTPEQARTRLQDWAALWSTGAAPGRTVIDAACEALVVGLDGPALRELAACEYADAVTDLDALLPPALAEQGLDFHPNGSRSADEAALRALAARCLDGELTPRELTRVVHQRWGHQLDESDPLSCLDDEYDMLDYGTRTREDLDADVLAEARRLRQ
ncbi:MULTISPECIES: GNAT family N-acetyltransferase [unclassified Kitasatospora]|uniref:GNAT family N-acetyltransferase n=1 Tax=unclassified Kitasatospora TaxID=2633591 RepID=UPI0033EE0D30